MLLYILKSTTILAILLLFYKLLLEKESMHTFKRFYLLGSLIMAFTIPFITFVEYVDAPTISHLPQPMVSYTTTTIVPQQVDLIEYLPYLLWSIYVIGFLFYAYKFVKNLYDLVVKIRKNPKYKIKQITNVLLIQNITPHTFFNFIFFNKHKFESKQIPREVLLHEETHARQKHSIDVLLIEFIQVIFWFNPLIRLIKKAIKLNHEFLADKAVINNGIQPTLYQQLLLEFSSNPHQPALANAINYSSIKKRFTIMKTRTSKKSIVLRSLLLLPILAVLILSFSGKRLMEKVNDTTSITLNFEIKHENEVWYKGEHILLENLAKSLSKETINRKKDESLNIEIFSPKSLNSDFLNLLDKELNKLKPTMVNVSANEYILPESEYQDDVEITPATIHLKANKINIEKEELNSFVISIQKNKNSIRLKCTKGCRWADITLDTKSRSRYIINDYGFSEGKTLKTDIFAFSIEPSRSGVHFSSLKGTAWLDLSFSLPKNQIQFINEKGMLTLNNNKTAKHQQGATKSQIKEYNALALKYNRRLSKDKSIQIFKSDVERLEYLHGIMTHEQKESAEPFPDFPEPPPAPQAPIVKEGEVSNIPPPPPPFKVPSRDGNYSEELLKAYDKFNEEGDIYGKAVTNYMKNGKGKITSLHEKYKKVMVLYDKFHALAVKENLMKPNVKSSPNVKMGEPSNIPPPPPPAPMVRKGEKSDIPPPPKVAKEPKAKKGKKNNLPPPPSASNISEVEVANKVIDEIIAHQDPYDVVGDPIRSQVLKSGAGNTLPPPSPYKGDFNYSKSSSKQSNQIGLIQTNSNFELPNSPKLGVKMGHISNSTPPPPKSPLDHVIEMAKKDATFLYEGKKITSDKAITILKKNKKINIRTKHEGRKTPIVELSTKPIKVKK